MAELLSHIELFEKRKSMGKNCLNMNFNGNDPDDVEYFFATMYALIDGVKHAINCSQKTYDVLNQKLTLLLKFDFNIECTKKYLIDIYIVHQHY